MTRLTEYPYVNGKCVITACDNMAFVKKLSCIAELMDDEECGCPYNGAKEAYILEFQDLHKVRRVIGTLWKDLPFPKSKKKCQTEPSMSPDSGYVMSPHNPKAFPDFGTNTK